MMFVFGDLIHLPAGIGTLSFILVVCFLIFFEYVTNAIEYLKDFHPASYLMVQKVYKELMIMGLVSFTLVMIATSSSSSESGAIWIEAIDFGHITLFFMALFFIVHAGFLIIQSQRISIEYQRHHSLLVRDILNKMRDNASFWGQFIYSHKWVPGSRLRKIVEFKIIHLLFRDAYAIPLSFNYPSYLTSCHEKYALQLLDIGVFSWLSMIGFSILNFVRVVLVDVGSVGCTYTVLGFPVTKIVQNHRRKLDLSYLTDNQLDCEARMLSFFIASGYSLFCIQLTVLFLARMYELRLIEKSGACTTADYESLLRHMKKDEQLKRTVLTLNSAKLKEDNNSTSERRISVNKRYSNIKTLKSGHKDLSLSVIKNNVETEKRLNESSKAVAIRRVHEVWSAFLEFYHNIRGSATAAVLFVVRKVGRTCGCLARGSHVIDVSTHDGSSVVQSPSSASVGHKINRAQSVFKLDTANAGHKIKRAQSVFKIDKRSFMKSEIVEDTKEAEKKEAPAPLPKRSFFSDIYLFRSEHLYFRIVEIVVMLNCLYMALWAANFITLANDFQECVALQLIMVLPILLSIPILGAIISVSAKLNAIRKLDFEVIGKVLEQDEEFDNQLQTLRDRIDNIVTMVRVDESLQSIMREANPDSALEARTFGRPEVLQAMIDELQPDNGGFIDQNMFRRVLRLLHIYLSEAKFFRLYHMMLDSARQDKISIEAFLGVVFKSDAELSARSRDEAALKAAAVAYNLQVAVAELSRDVEEPRPNRRLSQQLASVMRVQSANLPSGGRRHMSQQQQQQQSRERSGGVAPVRGSISFRSEKLSSAKIRAFDSSPLLGDPSPMDGFKSCLFEKTITGQPSFQGSPNASGPHLTNHVSSGQHIASHVSSGPHLTNQVSSGQHLASQVSFNDMVRQSSYQTLTATARAPPMSADNKQMSFKIEEVEDESDERNNV